MNTSSTALRTSPEAPDGLAPIRRRPRAPIPDLTGFASARADRDPGYTEFLPAALEILETPPSRIAVVTGYIACALCMAALLWSLFGHLGLYAVASGEIQARGGTQVVEPRIAGQVMAILFKDGDHVAKDEIVVRLDPTTAVANQTVIRDKLADQRAAVARLQAEIAAARKAPVDTAPSVTWATDLPAAVRAREESVLRADLSQLAATISDLSTQRNAKETARDKFAGSIEAQKSLIATHSDRTAMHQQLASQGWDSRAKVLDALEPLKQEEVSLAGLQGSRTEAEAAIAVLNSQITRAVESFVATNTQQLTAAERQVNDLAQQLVKADQAVSDATLRSPVAGTIHGSTLTTVGQQVKPGQQLLQVVPDGEPLEIVAYVLNTDIGFVKQGQKATIKVDTFPYTRYGTIEGTVTRVAADAITGALALQRQKNGALPETRGSLSVTNAAQQTTDLVFPVTITPSKETIRVDGRDAALSPGMSVAVEIETERQRAISYILYPLARAVPHGVQ